MGNKKWVPLVFDRDIDAYNEVMAHFTQTILAAHRQWKGNENVAVCQSVPDEGITSEIAETIHRVLDEDLTRSIISRQWAEVDKDNEDQRKAEARIVKLQIALDWLATQTKGGE